MFTGINSFIVIFSTLNLVSWSSYTVTVSQISNIEKAFGLSSSESGWLLTVWELGYMICTVFASYFGHRAHLTRVIGVSMIFCGLSGFIIAMPHFVAFSESIFIENENINTSSSKDGYDVTLCTFNKPPSYGNSSSKQADSATLGHLVKGSGKTIAYVLLNIGMIVQGVGKAPTYPYSAQYIDDNVDKQKTGFYIGIVSSITVFGLALGFGIGSLISSVYVTLKSTTLSSTDTRLIGAWWLGFISVGVALSLTAIPMFCFPRRLNTSRQNQLQQQTHLDNISFVQQIKHVVATIISILKSPLYALTLAAACFQILSFASFEGFEPKYMFTQFEMPLWQVNVLLGGIGISSYSIGCFVGGCITKKWKLSPYRTILLIIFLLAIVTIVMTIAAFLGCKPQTIHMEPIDHTHSSVDIGCNCNGSEFLPICGNDGNIYFSPCHAGCRFLNKDVLTNCSAVPGGVAIMGRCPSRCRMVWPYSVAKFILNIFDAMSSIPIFLVFLRSAGAEHKALAIGLSAGATSLLAWLPGPVIGGRIIDSTCLIWNTASTSSKYCAHYNIEALRFRIHGFMIGLRVISVAIFGIVLIKAKDVSKWATGDAQNYAAVDTNENRKTTDNTVDRDTKD